MCPGGAVYVCALATYLVGWVSLIAGLDWNGGMENGMDYEKNTQKHFSTALLGSSLVPRPLPSGAGLGTRLIRLCC